MDFLPFFIILLVSILFAVVFRRFHLPWVLALITAGIIVGPHGLHFVDSSPTLEFLGQIGLIFLMFMAGLETKIDTIRRYGLNIVLLAAMNAFIPFGAGYFLGYWFGFGVLPSIMLGVIFMSSSIAVIVPTLEATGLIDTKVGKSILAATVIEDAVSLIALSILLQNINPITDLPLPSFYILLAFILAVFAYGLPKIRDLIPKQRKEKDLFESEVRIIVAMLIGVVVIFELLGLHPIIAGFFAGLVLSKSVTSELLIDKLRTLSYGLFIPVFFVVIGMNTDIGILRESSEAVGLVLAVIGLSIGTKFLSGWLGAKLSGFKKKDALTIGIATTPQLSTTLAVVFAAVELGLLGPELITAMVALSVVSTLIAPVILRNMYQVRD